LMPTDVVAVRLVPVRVTGTAVPTIAVTGVIEVNVGDTTVNAPIRMLLVPVGVVTLTLLAPGVAVLANVKVAVTVVEFTTVILLTAIPVPLVFTAVAPVRLVPVSVTETAVP